MTDWLLITTIISVLAFITSSIFVFFKIAKKKPSLLRLAEIKTEVNDESTTYNWNLILNIIVRCIAFGTATFILSNVVIFVIFGMWYIDSRSVGVLAVVFGVFMFKEFDKFVTGVLK